MNENIGTCQNSMLLHVPDILLESILSYFTYNEIANLRIVCQKFNEVCKRLLNRGFRSVEHYHMKCQKEVKSQLPRRESERRDHPLAHHCNILSGIETRLSLLNMTFLKYVDAKLCCFIPGKVIDEIYRVLRFVQSTKKLFIGDSKINHEARNNILKELRANVILKELRDISSMAMEHFEEKILPAFKTPTTSSLISFFSSSPPHFSHSIPPFVSLSPSITGNSSNTSDPSSISPEQITHLGNLKLYSKQNKSLINSLKKQLTSIQGKLNEACRKVSEQDQVILELNRVLSEQTSKLSDHENKIAELNRKMMENEQKMSAFLNLANCNNTNFSSPGFTFPVDTATTSSSAPTKSVSIATNVGASTSGMQSLPHLGQAYQSTAFFLAPGVVQPTLISMGVGSSQAGALSPGVSSFSPPLVLPSQQTSGQNSSSSEKEQSYSPPPKQSESLENPLEAAVSQRGRRKRRAQCESSEPSSTREQRCKRLR